MNYISYANSGKPYFVGGERQHLRAQRRQGVTTARQQIKAAKAHRRALKLSA